MVPIPSPTSSFSILDAEKLGVGLGMTLSRYHVIQTIFAVHDARGCVCWGGGGSEKGLRLDIENSLAHSPFNFDCWKIND